MGSRRMVGVVGEGVRMMINDDARNISAIVLQWAEQCQGGWGADGEVGVAVWAWTSAAGVGGEEKKTTCWTRST
jgi:hypothetical protein